MWCGKGLEPILSHPDWDQVREQVATVIDGALSAQVTAAG
jgi:hypothetical protein